MILVKDKKLIEVKDWDNLVRETYGKNYSFQQQDGCKERGIVYITIPLVNANENYMHESIPEEVNGETMGVKFKSWIDRDPKQKIPNQKHDYQLNLFWKRNFYPDVNILANDLCEKGLIDAGNYIININW